MVERSVYEIASACGGIVYNCCGDKNITIFVNDDKKCVNNCCYVSIKGDRFDGNSFINSAIINGAGIVLTEKEPSEAVPFILVKNITEALGKIARYYRYKELARVVAVTGSVGKTTVKEMCAAVLSEKTRVRKSEGNKNNLLGLPLSLLSDIENECAVIEAGISEQGEMERLSAIACPDIAVITCIGSMHAETLGEKEDIAAEKLKILSHAQKECVLIVPESEPLLKGRAKNTVTVGVECVEADYNVFNIFFDENGSRFDIKTRSGAVIKDLSVAMLGKHACIDAAFAVAVAELCGVKENDIRHGLKRYKSDGIRQNIIEKNGVTVMVDCYNFGPESAEAAFDAFSVLKALKKPRKSIAMLGSMLELGVKSESEHIRVGKLLARSGTDCLITVGDIARNIALGALIGGMKAECVYSFGDDQRRQASTMLKEQCVNGSMLLLKGSRKMKMEEFFDL